MVNHTLALNASTWNLYMLSHSWSHIPGHIYLAKSDISGVGNYNLSPGRAAKIYEIL